MRRLPFDTGWQRQWRAFLHTEASSPEPSAIVLSGSCACNCRPQRGSRASVFAAAGAAAARSDVSLLKLACTGAVCCQLCGEAAASSESVPYGGGSRPQLRDQSRLLREPLALIAVGSVPG